MLRTIININININNFLDVVKVLGPIIIFIILMLPVLIFKEDINALSGVVFNLNLKFKFKSLIEFNFLHLL